MDNITSIQTVYNPQELQRIQMLYSLMAIQEQRKQESDDKKKKENPTDNSLRYISSNGSAVTMTPNVPSTTLKAKEESKDGEDKDKDKDKDKKEIRKEG